MTSTYWTVPVTSPFTIEFQTDYYKKGDSSWSYDDSILKKCNIHILINVSFCAIRDSESCFNHQILIPINRPLSAAHQWRILPNCFVQCGESLLLTLQSTLD